MESIDRPPKSLPRPPRQHSQSRIPPDARFFRSNIFSSLWPLTRPSPSRSLLMSSGLILLLALIARQHFCVAKTALAPVNDDFRLVSLAPNLTEILFALDCGPQIVGVTMYCRYPPEVQSKERVGDFIHPNLEKIISLQPDLVVAERWISSKTVPRLRQLGLTVKEVGSPKSLLEIYQLIAGIGTLVGRSEQATCLIADMKARVTTIREKAKQLPHRPTLYIEIDPPSWTIGRHSFITDAVFTCGARNLFEDIERPALQASKESIVQRNPEVILSLEASAEEIGRRAGWHKIRAVRKGNIIDDLDRNLLSHANHRLVEAMEILQRRLQVFLDTSP